MASSFGIQSYTAISYDLWTVWKILAPGFLFLNFGENLRWTIASFGSMTYVEARRRAFSRSNGHLVSFKHADAQRRSRRGAFVTFFFCWVWLYELASQAILMSSRPIFRGFIATIICNNDM
jgi:hypothetical protein